VIVGTYLILLLTFGSIFLPIKAILMTLLSISASLGALVLVFQDGTVKACSGSRPRTNHLDHAILMFCILFGLSMDYEVLMLTRIQEEYVRQGHPLVDRLRARTTAKTITSAAAIMVVAFEPSCWPISS